MSEKCPKCPRCASKLIASQDKFAGDVWACSSTRTDLDGFSQSYRCRIAELEQQLEEKSSLACELDQTNSGLRCDIVELKQANAGLRAENERQRELARLACDAAFDMGNGQAVVPWSLLREAAAEAAKGASHE